MRRISLFILISLLWVPAARAQWVPNGVFATASSDHTAEVAIVTDGAGGAIVVWSTGLDVHSDLDVRAQRYDASGYRLWGVTGVSVCAATGTQYGVSAVSDEAGGVVIAWSDKRTGVADIYAQHLDDAGTPQWTTNGVPVCTATEQQQHPRLLSRGGGAALVVWEDRRNDPAAADIYIQYVDPTGTPQWTANGNPVCVATGIQYQPELATDTESGAIVVWSDGRNGADYDLYAQRINFLGAASWTTNGAPVSGYAGDQIDPQIVADGVGGAVVMWEDYRWVGPAADIYGQRLNPDGSRAWTGSIDGVGTAVFGATALSPRMVSVGNDGVILTWLDQRTSSDQQVYANRVDLNGVRHWSGGLDLTVTGDHRDPAIAADGTGGAVIAWRHNNGTSSDIHSQRVDTNGNRVWGSSTRTVCNATGAQVEPHVIADPSRAIVAWRDHRGTEYRPFAQRLHMISGFWGLINPKITWLFDLPDDFGGMMELRFAAVAQEEMGPETVERYAIFRLPPPAAPGASTARRGTGSAQGELAPPQPPWEEVGEVIPSGLAEYEVDVPTVRDATGGDTAMHQFIVCAVLDGYDHCCDADSGDSWNNKGSGTGVGDTPALTGLQLLPNAPNPFGSATTIRFGSQSRGTVTMDVYDVAGRRVATRQLGAQAGWHEYVFDGRGDDGRPLPSGVYLYRVRGAGETRVRKMIVAR